MQLNLWSLSRPELFTTQNPNIMKKTLLVHKIITKKIIIHHHKKCNVVLVKRLHLDIMLTFIDPQML